MEPDFAAHRLTSNVNTNEEVRKDGHHVTKLDENTLDNTGLRWSV